MKLEKVNDKVWMREWPTHVRYLVKISKHGGRDWDRKGLSLIAHVPRVKAIESEKKAYRPK